MLRLEKAHPWGTLLGTTEDLCSHLGMVLFELLPAQGEGVWFPTLS